jgi:hypothetical protein
MMDLSDRIIPYKNYQGDWHKFIEDLYEVFVRDFIASMPTFKGHNVDFADKRRIDSNKEECFWHITSRDYKIIQKGLPIIDRKPDIIRAERIAWIREIIENADDPSILMWINKTGFKAPRYHLWYNHEFLVVINDLDRYGAYSLITSFHTSRDKDIEKYMDEYRRWT